MIAVHCGAGNHGRNLHTKYNKLSEKACQKGMEILLNGGTALDAVKEAVMVLEDHPITNAGCGSNLTITGQVEGDASVMDGKTLTYGGCGSVKKVKNPVELAYNICKNQLEPLPLGLVQPSLLVGLGGLQYAKDLGLNIVSNNALRTAKTLRQYKKYKKMLDYEQQKPISRRFDTVGAVCVDKKGHVAVACSSGGLILKRPGRVGQAALFGSGVWADSFSVLKEPSVAVCTTGCGEYLVQTQLAKEIANDLKFGNSPTVDLHDSMTEKFIKSRFLRNVPQKFGGALVLHVNNDNGEVDLLWGHSTQTMSVGYMKAEEEPKSLISHLPAHVRPGTSVNVGGTHFCLINESNKVVQLEAT